MLSYLLICPLRILAVLRGFSKFDMLATLVCVGFKHLLQQALSCLWACPDCLLHKQNNACFLFESALSTSCEQLHLPCVFSP